MNPKRLSQTGTRRPTRRVASSGRAAVGAVVRAVVSVRRLRNYAQDPDYDDRSVSKSYRSDGTEIKESDADYDDPSGGGVGTKLQGGRDRTQTRRSGLGRPVAVSFAIDELSVHARARDGSPL